MARPKPGDLETRDAADLLDAEGKRIRGRIPFGVESRDMGGWREVIAPGALSNTKLDDLVATVDHVGVPIGRYPSTLQLEERDDGVHWSVDPPKSRADLIEAVERGDLRAGSWRMRVARDEWRGDVRHVLEIAELRDVSVVTAPAYEAAAVEYRSSHQPNPAAGQEDVMADPAEQTTTDTIEERSEPQRLPAGSLRVEERSEPLMQMYSLADMYASRGFFENNSASVTWDEYRSLTWSGGTIIGLDNLNPVRREGVGLGYDNRFLYPVLPQTGVSDSTTSVQYLRQSARSLAGTAVIRAIDATSTKPETGSTVEIQTLSLSQVATVQSGIPRIHAAQPMFQTLVEADLRLSINEGLDEIVRRGIATAGTAAAVTGTDVLQKVRKAITVVQSNGYNPSVLAIDPAGAEALDLLQTAGSEKIYVWGPGRATPTGPFGLQMRVWKTAGTALLDADAFGRLYASPVELRSFEADGGLTNKTNVRMELNAGFAVERLPAGLRIV